MQGAPTEAVTADEERAKRNKSGKKGGTKPYRSSGMSIGGGQGGSSSGGVGV
tara:strand:- start:13636 stop:13791 length:156 start_codon:yes stop_codon:yes gene_type:complete